MTTTPKTLEQQLEEMRKEREAKIAAFDAAQAAEIAALKAASEAEAAAAAKAAEDAAKAADEADAAAKAAEEAAKAAKEKHTKLFPSPAPTRRPIEVVTEILRRILSGWLFAVLILLLAILVWVFFPRPTSNVQTVQVEVPTPAVITVVIEATQEAPTAIATEAVPTATAAEAPKPTAAKPAAEAPKPTSAKAPAANPAPVPVTWNSGEFGQYQPKAGTICHGDQVGPFGKSDGTGPVVVKFWSDQPSVLDMVWVSCEWGTGRTPEQIKTEVDKKYSKNFEIVNN